MCLDLDYVKCNLYKYFKLNKVQIWRADELLKNTNQRMNKCKTF